jgi:hypothetical protein
MAIFLTQNGEPDEYGLAYNDNAYVIKTTNYTPTVRFRVAMLPIDYPISCSHWSGQGLPYPLKRWAIFR